MLDVKPSHPELGETEIPSTLPTTELGRRQGLDRGKDRALRPRKPVQPEAEDDLFGPDLFQARWWPAPRDE
jgi:hypothetical protein